ncbi:hypothetical protein C1I95_04970 [Micromonospora craterilacus]|uniref:Lipopolysaccharide assembly protein A domain-containing protein n=1 Tax=Micromonospora craterilacus TaxID=1655439 RepID=A0A2W2EEH7_9ACTN|nr:LapA family protein [Micromonospora craterilacus]PZG22612.1 hypothetical protein C1I95_04970 [Micromonospora craterilacus]
MARFGLARSTPVQSGPEINGRSRAVPRTRAGRPHVALATSALLLLLLVFILQNGQRMDVRLFGAQGQLPVGVALLLAVVFGVLLVTVHATMRRIIQLRLFNHGRRTPSTTITRPDRAATDPRATDPRADVPEERNP